MKVSRIIKKLLGNNEKVFKNFTLSSRFLKIKMLITSFVFLIVFAILGASAYFFISQPGIGDSVSYDLETGLSYEQSGSGFLNQEIDNNLIVIWLLMAAVYLLVVIPIAWFYHFYYLRISNQYVFTNQRILIKRGWLNTKVITIHYNRMTDASVKQDLIDKIIGIGGLSVSTAGSEGYKIQLIHIDKPSQRKRELYNLKEDYRQRLYRGDKAVAKENRDSEHY